MSEGLTRRAHPKSKFERYEDEKLKRLVAKFGTDNWNAIAKKMKDRTVRQVRERWLNYLDPNLNTSEWTPEEDKLLYEKFDEIGRKWKIIASFFKNRTDINVKNRWLMLERHRKKALKQKEQETEQQEASTPNIDIEEKEEENKVELIVPQQTDEQCELKDIELVDFPLSIQENQIDYSNIYVEFPVLNSVDDWFSF